MIIMALDHTRDFMHIDSLSQNPLDLATTTPLLFFTRWITHFCAPVFVFLSGTSAFLSFKNRANIVQKQALLVSRGIWLIILEFTVINFAIWFDLHFRVLIFEVIAAIGFGFIFLSFLLKMPAIVIGAIGLVIIFGHNLLSGIQFEDNSIIKLILSPLLNFNLFSVTPQFSLLFHILLYHGSALCLPVSQPDASLNCLQSKERKPFSAQVYLPYWHLLFCGILIFMEINPLVGTEG